MAYQSFLNPMPVTFTWAGLTDAQLRATAVPVSGTVTVGNASLAVTGTFWQALQPTSVTDVSASGSLTALNQAVTLSALNGKQSGLIQLSGTWVGTVQLEGSNDGFVTATTLSTTQSGGAAPSTTPIAANGDYRVLGTINYAGVRARCSAFTSGTIVTNLKVSDASGIQPVISTNAAGFLCTATLGAGAAVIGAVTQSGTWNVGSITTLPALATGANVIGALTANQSVNNTQINGVALLAGNGVTGTGSQRVTIASDNTAFSVIATQAIGANSTTGDTGAKTATGNGATQTNAGNKGVQILIVMGAVTGTTPTFVGKIQGSVDGGTTFYDIPGAATASLTATGNFGIMLYPGIAVTAGTTTSGTTATANMVLSRTWRIVWTIGGTTPSFTITNIQYNYLVN